MGKFQSVWPFSWAPNILRPQCIGYPNRYHSFDYIPYEQRARKKDLQGRKSLAAGTQQKPVSNPWRARGGNVVRVPRFSILRAYGMGLAVHGLGLKVQGLWYQALSPGFCVNMEEPRSPLKGQLSL